jgi:hypothetical protein
VNGVERGFTDEHRRLWLSLRAGERVTMLVERGSPEAPAPKGGPTQEVSVTLGSALDSVPLFPVIALTGTLAGAVYVAAGTTVAWSRPDQLMGRLLALSFGATGLALVGLLPLRDMPFDVLLWVRGPLAAVAAFSLFHFFLLFPSPLSMAADMAQFGPPGWRAWRWRVPALYVYAALLWFLPPLLMVPLVLLGGMVATKATRAGPAWLQAPAWPALLLWVVSGLWLVVSYFFPPLILPAVLVIIAFRLARGLTAEALAALRWPLAAAAVMTVVIFFGLPVAGAFGPRANLVAVPVSFLAGALLPIATSAALLRQPVPEGRG